MVLTVGKSFHPSIKKLSNVSSKIRMPICPKSCRPGPDGAQAFVLGQPTVWEERGDFRLTVAELLGTETDGVWRLAFERAKAVSQKAYRPGDHDPVARRRQSHRHADGRPLAPRRPGR